MIIYLILAVYIIAILLITWFDKYEYIGTQYKDKEIWYKWHWNKTLHTIYINKEINDFCFQHVIQQEYPITRYTEASKTTLYEFPRKEKDYKFYKEQKKIEKDKNSDLLELMNKTKGDI